MRFRLALFIGLAVGYVLGTRAGRERYEQIATAYRKLSRTQPAIELQAQAREVAARAGNALEEKAAEGVHKVTEAVRSAASDD